MDLPRPQRLYMRQTLFLLDPRAMQNRLFPRLVQALPVRGHVDYPQLQSSLKGAEFGYVTIALILFGVMNAKMAIVLNVKN